MLFQRINRTDPEKVFVVVKAGENLLQGRPVCLHFDGTNDGVDGYLTNAASDATLVIGLAHTAITSGEFGLVQCYGYRTDAQITNATSAARDTGAILAVASELSGHLTMSVSVGAATAVQPAFVLANSATVAVTASSDGVQAVPVFIRCM